MTFGGLLECNIFFDNSNHKADYIGKYSDKTVIEICKSYEYLNVSNIRKSLSILNNFNFLKVYTDAFGGNN